MQAMLVAGWPRLQQGSSCPLQVLPYTLLSRLRTALLVGNVLHYRLAQVLVTSRELPLQHHLLRLGEFGCEMSWNAAGTAHVYVRRDLQRAPEGLLAHYCCREGICWLPNTGSHPTFAVQRSETTLSLTCCSMLNNFCLTAKHAVRAIEPL
ncbi:histone H3-K79 methyltransferase [Haematococcus lacustris]|uniref:Histone H3-K79 methyltransferase n=1 Tax=Haematococcus lacustris TaxID=44745 RepID=A0A699YVK5_HAELA|nr:histone H3-K79 methyltransferase [Haematococcus lacustris]